MKKTERLKNHFTKYVINSSLLIDENSACACGYLVKGRNIFFILLRPLP